MGARILGAAGAAILVSYTTSAAEPSRYDPSPYQLPATDLILLRDRPPPRKVTRSVEQAWESMRSVQRIQVRGLYGQLFIDLELTEPQTDAVTRLIAEKVMLTSSWTSGEVSFRPQDEDLQQATAIDSRLAEALGQTGFQQYQQYQDTLFEQARLRGVRQLLVANGQPLTREQARALVSAMRLERSLLEASPDAEAFTIEYAEDIVRRRDEYDRRILPSFDALLSVEQRAVAASYFKTQRERRHRGLESYRRALASGSRILFTYPVD